MGLKVGATGELAAHGAGHDLGAVLVVRDAEAGVTAPHDAAGPAGAQVGDEGVDDVVAGALLQGEAAGEATGDATGDAIGVAGGAC